MQPCGHNPTGIDLKKEEWDKLLLLFQQRQGLFMYFDLAYFGFASGSLETDIYPVRTFFMAGLNFALSNSFAKNMGL